MRGTHEVTDFASPARRAAPYASARSLREFLQRIQGLGVPARIDREYLRRLNVAQNNEWSLLSALKFLGVVTSRGTPGKTYRLLQTSDQGQSALAALVSSAYQELIAAGGLAMDQEQLRNYFRLTSSASQAKNAARFFREVAEMAGLLDEDVAKLREMHSLRVAPPSNVLELTPLSRRPESEGEAGAPWNPEDVERRPQEPRKELSEAKIVDFDPLIRTRVSLIDKMPSPRPDWTAEDYRQACESFVAMCDRLESLLTRFDR